MGIAITQVDAFTSKPFAGNPAAVCILSKAPEERWMRDVAREMNLSETAFLVPQDGGFNLRWFTPAIEVDLCGLLHLGRKIHLDPVAVPLGQQQPATRVEARLRARGQMAFLPKHVRAGQRSVTAEVHFNGRREPAQVVPSVLRNQKRGFRQVHLARYIPHPALFGRLGEDAHRRRISGERLAGESVHLRDGDAHILSSVAGGERNSCSTREPADSIDPLGWFRSQPAEHQAFNCFSHTRLLRYEYDTGRSFELRSRRG